MSSPRLLALPTALGLVLCACGSHTTSRPPAPGEHPNIVVIDIDSMRADRLGARRNGEAVVPNLDALAARGIVFDQAVSQGGWTVPALASLLSGRYPLGLRQSGASSQLTWLPEGTRTLPELLAAQGYQTALYTGISIAYAGSVASRFETILQVPPAGEPWRVAPLTRWISEEATEPFFALLHDQDLNILLPDDDQARVCRWAPDPEACRGVPRGPLPNDCTDPGSAGGAPDPVRLHAARYDGTLALYDDALGALMEALERRGLAEHTLVVVTSDHGQELGEHGICGHGFLYDTVLRIPLVIVDPRRPAESTPVPWQVQTIDIAPTLLELAGLQAPEDLDGRSLVPLMEGSPPEDAARPALSLSDRHAASLRAPPLKLWHVDGGAGKLGRVLGRAQGEDIDEVFDLDADPGEQHDLGLESPGAAAGFAALRAWLAGQVASAGEPEAPDPALVRRLQHDGYWDHVDPEPKPPPKGSHPGPKGPPPERARPTSGGAGAR